LFFFFLFSSQIARPVISARIRMVMPMPIPAFAPVLRDEDWWSWGVEDIVVDEEEVDG